MLSIHVKNKKIHTILTIKNAQLGLIKNKSGLNYLQWNPDLTNLQG